MVCGEGEEEGGTPYSAIAPQGAVRHCCWQLVEVVEGRLTDVPEAGVMESYRAPVFSRITAKQLLYTIQAVLATQGPLLTPCGLAGPVRCGWGAAGVSSEAEEEAGTSVVVVRWSTRLSDMN